MTPNKDQNKDRNYLVKATDGTVFLPLDTSRWFLGAVSLNSCLHNNNLLHCAGLVHLKPWMKVPKLTQSRARIMPTSGYLGTELCTKDGTSHRQVPTHLSSVDNSQLSLYAPSSSATCTFHFPQYMERTLLYTNSPALFLDLSARGRGRLLPFTKGLCA